MGSCCGGWGAAVGLGIAVGVKGLLWGWGVAVGLGAAVGLGQSSEQGGKG